eukprot:6420055-Amphidinium_carterae.1
MRSLGTPVVVSVCAQGAPAAEEEKPAKIARLDGEETPKPPEEDAESKVSSSPFDHTTTCLFRILLLCIVRVC